MDPLAHLRPGLTPYHYVQNNPLNRFDPDGMKAKEWKSVVEQVTAEFGGGQTSQKAVKLLSSLISSGTNIPSNALNDKWIALAIDGGTISQDLMIILKV